MSIKDAFTGHFLGDFALQNDWMAQRKRDSWRMLVCHALTYAAAFPLVGETSLPRLAALALSHGVIDALKARWRVIPTVWLDQAAHALVLQLLYADPNWGKRNGVGGR